MRYFEQSVHLERSDKFDEPFVDNVACEKFERAVRLFVVEEISHPVVHRKAIVLDRAVCADPIAARIRAELPSFAINIG